MQMQQSLRAEIEQHWKSKGWDPALLKNFVMSNVEPEVPPGDVITIPGGLETDPEPNLGNPPAQSTQQVNPATGKTYTQAELDAERERVRQEEKDKLYGNLQTMEEELKAMRAEREKETAAQQKAREAAEAEAKKKAEEEMSAKELLAQREQEWQERFANLESARERDLAVMEMERRLAEVESYKAKRLGEEADRIMPELRDLVSGSTPDEIENSIATAINKTDAILASVQQHRQQERQQQRGASVTAPPVGPLENEASYETITADDIRNMSMADYAKNRTKLMQAASRRQ